MDETLHPPASVEPSGITTELDAVRRERDEARHALRLLREQYARCTELARRQTMAMHELQQAISHHLQQPVADVPNPAPLTAVAEAAPMPDALPGPPPEAPQRSLLRRLARTLR